MDHGAPEGPAQHQYEYTHFQTVMLVGMIPEAVQRLHGTSPPSAPPTQPEQDAADIEISSSEESMADADPYPDPAQSPQPAMQPFGRARASSEPLGREPSPKRQAVETPPGLPKVPA